MSSSSLCDLRLDVQERVRADDGHQELTQVLARAGEAVLDGLEHAPFALTFEPSHGEPEPLGGEAGAERLRLDQLLPELPCSREGAATLCRRQLTVDIDRLAPFRVAVPADRVVLLQTKADVVHDLVTSAAVWPRFDRGEKGSDASGRRRFHVRRGRGRVTDRL